MAAEQDLDVFEAKAQLADGVLNGRYISLVDRIDQNVTFRSRHEKRGEALGPDVIDVTDDLVRRELLVLLLRAPYVASEQFLDCPNAGRLLK